MLESVPGTNLY